MKSLDNKTLVEEKLKQYLKFLDFETKKLQHVDIEMKYWQGDFLNVKMKFMSEKTQNF